MEKVIIDCDPGIDDSLALMLAAASPELEILGITTVSGNVPARMGAENARKVLKQVNRLDIPIYVGEEVPLKEKYVDAMDTHGRDGMGESFLPAVPGEFPEKSAVEFLEETLTKRFERTFGEMFEGTLEEKLRDNAGQAEESKISILALGPMTNLAKVFSKKPELIGRVHRLVSMGGSFKSHGNCSPVAEYNYWCDPDAAAYVYRNLPVKIHMVGLDVTRRIVLRPDLLEYISQISPQEGEFLRKITRFYFDFHWVQEEVLGCVINDPLAVAYLIDPSLCSGIDLYTDIVTEGIALGQSVCDEKGIWKKKPNSHVLTQTDPVRFMHLFLERTAGARDPQLSRVLGQLYPGERFGFSLFAEGREAE